MTSPPKATEIMGPARRNSPLYLADLNRCLPASSLSREGRLFGWRMIDYETENFKGIMLRAGPETAAAAVEYPLELQGWYDIYLGLFNTAWRPYPDQRLWVKLTEDPAFSCLFLQAPSVDKGQVVQDLFWRTADLTGQRLSFKQVATELIPAGHPCRSNCDTVWVAYIKLVPLDPDEVEALQSDRVQTGTRRLFATQDWGSGFAWDASEGAIRDMLEAYRHTDFKRIYWEGAAGDLCSYFSRVARTWTPEYARMEDYPVPAYRRIVENFTEYEQRGIDPFRVAIDYSHELGLEFHASYRFCEGMGPFHFSPPFDQINRGGFYDRHPELRAVRRDGSRAPRISLSYPETREFLISLFLEMAEYPVDGISILYNRRPPFVEYEPPLVEGFREEFGQDPREIDEKDPRWLRYRASVLTEFMRELRQRLHRQAHRQGRSRPAALSAWVFGGEEENLGDYIRKCREFRLMGYNSYHESPRNYPVQSQAVQGWNPAVGRGEVHPESAVQRCTGGTQDGLGIRATRRDPVRSDEGVDLPEEGRSGGARVGGGQGGAWDVDAVGPGLQGVLPSLQGGGEAGVSSIPAHCEDGDHRRRRPEGDPGEEARSGLRHPAQGLPDDPDISVPAVAGRMPVEGVADCPQAEPGVCGPDVRGGEAAATEMRVFGGDRPGSPQASGAVHG